MVAVNLAHDLGKRGIAAVVLHPGMVATAMTFDDERHEARPPEEAAAALIERIDQVEQAEPGAQPRLLARARAHDYPVVRETG